MPEFKGGIKAKCYTLTVGTLFLVLAEVGHRAPVRSDGENIGSQNAIDLLNCEIISIW